ncbi:MAG: hypothetical protein JSW58_04990 [Candidatus Latescibacterota bacterium]|nr:MAG: hypothetical protein JSW58_04990 [Candidatus Latescibacterota bacterium]
MAEPWDEFFIGKINEGLAIKSDSLTPEEEEFLRMPTPELPKTAPFSPEQAHKVQTKCFVALNEAYNRDVAGNKRRAALEWRKHNEELNTHSKAVIAGIVHNWFKSIEQSQKKRARGCLPVIAGFGLLLVLIVISIVKLTS